MSDILDWLLDQMTEAINKEIDSRFSYKHYGSNVFWSTPFLATTKRSKEMQINITIPDTDLDGLSIKDLIIADIHLGILCDNLNNYDYDMNYLIEKRELVKDELVKKLKAYNRKELQKIEAQIEARKPDTEVLKELEEKRNKLKAKMELKGY